MAGEVCFPTARSCFDVLLDFDCTCRLSSELCLGADALDGADETSLRVFLSCSSGLRFLSEERISSDIRG